MVLPNGRGVTFWTPILPALGRSATDIDRVVAWRSARE
jgi:hypothetical protein